MDLGLEGKKALITGSTRGLGKAIAEALAQEGATVIINGRDKETALRVAKEINDGYNVKAGMCWCDATSSKNIKLAFAESLCFHGYKLDILVNNVGNIEKFGSFDDLAEEDWQRSFDLTFMSAVRFINAALPYLKMSDQARIINISSLPAHQPGYFNPHYSVAKAALLNLTKHLANYLAKDQILVNAICPSTLDGGGWHKNVKDRSHREKICAAQAEEIMRQEEGKKSPLGRMGTLNDVANLVVFLASDKANFLTGQCYNVDGGITRSIL